MTAIRLLLAAFIAAVCSSCSDVPAALPPEPQNASVFIGTTPAGASVVAKLDAPSEPDSFVRWRLTLHRDARTQEPAGYQLRCDSETSLPGTDGKRKQPHTTERRGSYTIDRGRAADESAVIINLDNSLSFVQFNDNLIHLLDDDRALMVGNGGWSYTLNRQSAAELPVNEADVVFPPSDSYSLTPLATGPDVFGVFQGRSPIAGIWRELHRPGPLDAIKAKWRLTLFRDPSTGAPTTYRIDGTLYREGLLKSPQEPREGEWTIAEHPATRADVYKLGPWQSEPGLNLLVGDDNVLYFLDHNQNLLVGGPEFSYTLNRRTETQQTAATNR